MVSKTEIRVITTSSSLGRSAHVFENDDVVHLLKTAVESEGSQIAFAKRYGVNRSELNETLHGKRRVCDPLAKAIGLRKVYVVE